MILNVLKDPPTNDLNTLFSLQISTTSQFTPQSTSSASRSEVDSRLSTSGSLDRRDKVKKRLFTDEKTSSSSESKSYFTSSSTLSNHEKHLRNSSPVRISGIVIRNLKYNEFLAILEDLSHIYPTVENLWFEVKCGYRVLFEKFVFDLLWRI